MEQTDKTIQHLAEKMDRRHQNIMEQMQQTNQSIKELTHKVDSVARTAQAHSEAIAADRRSRQATDRQVAALTRNVADYIAASRQDTSALIEDRATMFEILQSLNEDRVTLAENMASIASSLVKLSEK